MVYSLQENVNNPNTIQSISRNIEYNTEGNHENSISVNKGSPERWIIKLTFVQNLILH